MAYYVSENINEGTFEDLETILDATFEMNFDEDSMEMDGIPIISDGHTARGYSLEQPMMVVAATGSGKTRRIIIQYLISCIKSACSMVINDPKGELYKHTKKLLEKLGYKTIVFDLRNLDDGERFNFCETPARLYQKGNTRRADEMFEAMFETFMGMVRSEKDPFWHTTSATYLTGLAELCCDLFPAEKVTINNIYEAHIQGSKRFGASTFLKTYLEMHVDKPYYKLIAPYINAPNETRASLDAVLTSAISKFCRNESVVDQTTNSTFEISDLVEEKTALFIISRDESTVYNSLITAMVNEIYEVIIDIAEDRYNGRLPRHLAFVLDEFGNLAPIDDINAKITVSRSRNVGWCLCCQSLDQLTLKYTADVAKVILGNCNIAYMYSSDINLLKMLSDLCGKTTDEYTHESRPLLSVEQLRHFDKKSGQTLFLLERMRPFIGFLPDISEYNIVPEVKAEFKKRKPQHLERVDFESIVKDEKKNQMVEKSNHTEASKTNTLDVVSQPRIPTFEEWMEVRHRNSVSVKSEENPLKDKVEESNNMNDGKDKIQELIDQIDRRIAELEEEERRELEECDIQDSSSVDELKTEAACSLVIKNMQSTEQTAHVIGECMNIPYAISHDILRQACIKGHRTIKGIPNDKAKAMVEKLKKIGTFAIIIEDSAA